MSRADENRDYIKKTNFPKQTYALSGMNWSNASIEKTADKYTTDAAPMLITPMPPGVFAYDNETWRQTFGASLDSFLSLMDGNELFSTIATARALIPDNEIFKESLFSAINSNIYDFINSRQQIQYVVSKQTTAEAQSALTFGAVDEARSICIRGPLHISGWGKTIGILPTDPNPSNRDNDDAHKLDRSSWKTGPLDVRWDEIRGCWRAWNDLVADQNDQGLGTLVFGTNGDSELGFPYIRGKLNDVWAVRKTFKWEGTPLSAVKQGDDGQSAEVLTIVSHRILDGDNAGALSDVFLVNGDKGDGNVSIAGTESTRDSLLTIGTFAEFNDGTESGPLNFRLDPSSSVVLGAFYFDGGNWKPGIDLSTGVGCSPEDLILMDNITQTNNALEQFGNDTNTKLDVDDELFRNIFEESLLVVEGGFSFIQNREVNPKIVDKINNIYTTAVEREIKLSANEIWEFMTANIKIVLEKFRLDINGQINAALISIVQHLLQNCGCTVPLPTVVIPAAVFAIGDLRNPTINVALERINLQDVIDVLHSDRADGSALLLNSNNASTFWGSDNPCTSTSTNYSIT